MKVNTLTIYRKKIKKLPIAVSIAFVVIVITILAAIFGKFLAPYDFSKIDLFNMSKPPSFIAGGTPDHFLGTDNLGRDIVSRLLYALQISISIATIGSLFTAVFGITMGILAAHFRGFIEDTIMMMADVTWSLPYIILSLAIIAIFGQNFFVLVLVIGIGGWETYARLTRAMILSINQKDFITALKTLGVPQTTIYLKHIFPNILNPLLIEFTVSFPFKILAESALSFIGLGVTPPLTSLGQMLGAGRDYLMTAPWIAVIPGSIIFVITLSMSTIGDWIRDVLDPTMR